MKWFLVFLGLGFVFSSYFFEEDSLRFGGKKYCIPKENQVEILFMPPISFGGPPPDGEFAYTCRGVKNCAPFPKNFTFFVFLKTDQDIFPYRVKDLPGLKPSDGEGINYYQNVKNNKGVENVNGLFFVKESQSGYRLIFSEKNHDKKENITIADDDLVVGRCSLYSDSNDPMSCYRRFVHEDFKFSYNFDYLDYSYEDLLKLDQEIVKKFKSLECPKNQRTDFPWSQPSK